MPADMPAKQRMATKQHHRLGLTISCAVDMKLAALKVGLFPFSVTADIDCISASIENIPITVVQATVPIVALMSPSMSAPLVNLICRLFTLQGHRRCSI
jgi:hypothetical protein